MASDAKRGFGSSLPIDPTPETQQIYNQLRDLELLHSRTTTSSPVGALNEVENEKKHHNEDLHRPQQRRQGRQGLLAPHTKMRAALMRILGACAECKAKKMKCTHHNMTKFEEEYQRRKQREGVVQQLPIRSDEVHVAVPHLQAQVVRDSYLIGGRTWISTILP
ncbi:hypothetical protein V8F20_003577 [Naviculisporaceae sp. PSN 640]